MLKSSILIFLVFLHASLFCQSIVKISLSETAKYSGFLCSSEQQMMKVKTGYLSNKKNFFQISILDQNFNGKFNDIGKDYITICPKKQLELRVSNGVSNSIILENNIIKTNNTYYRIVRIEPDGSSLSLQECSDCKEWTIKEIDKLPDASFERVDGSIDNFKNYSESNKYVYVEFWGTWCKGCIQVLPKIKAIYDKHKDKLIVIYLNGGETKNSTDVTAIIKKYSLESWIHGYATENIEKEFLQNGYPYGVLFDNNGNIIDFAVDPSTLEIFLDNQDKGEKQIN